MAVPEITHTMDRKAAKRVAIVGAGTSGLAACKHLLARGFRPVVFEAGASVGGLWTRTLASTRLQSPAAGYLFSDFPWPDGADAFPRHDQVVKYLAAYARRFGVDGRVRFRSKVVAAEYVGADGADDAELWAGNGEAFGGDGAGRWRLTVRHGDDSHHTTQVRVPTSKDTCAERPCTMVCRSPQWLLHDVSVWGRLHLGYLYMNRFAQLMVRKPGAGLASSLLATLLTPLAWLISKLTEAYYKKAIPMREYGMEPEQGFAGSIASCKIGMLPEAFYDKVRGGGVIIRRSRLLSFCEDGLVLDGGRVVPADLVILATGFRGDQKLRDMFVSPRVKDIVAGSPDTTVPLYRECVHPRIPQMAVIGYAESLTNIYAIEMMAKWVARFLDGAFRLPSVRRMERSVAEWGAYMRRSGGERFRRSCLGAVNIWYNDELCRDMGCEPRRKKGLLAEWFQPYGAVDYADIQ
ncbi:putative flavin-containing monooxygenase 1 isoform X2 [Panicum miliaceum]|uniref:Flavin-containing monooxygenase n=1 Tax=Panicum miliaceum TaxID=4540 RepID=A0A3L6TDK6_PANMI|nr:putative flavin-containing monooxygenase 1 isoform X2 [Panicum miliaceum]